MRITTAGESHGPGEICVVTGVPAGLSLSRADIDRELARRQQGYGRGGRMAIEQDRCRILSGVRHGKTLGSPISLLVENRDYANWRDAMGAEAPLTDQGVGWSVVRPVTLPRPGHADLAGVAKYGHTDIRNVLERASARETVARVAGGAVCKALLREFGVTIRARVIRIGEVQAALTGDFSDPTSVSWEAVEQSPVGCDDPDASLAMCAAIDRARTHGDSLGGVFEVWCWGVCPGLGSYTVMEDRLDARLAAAVMSIPGVKGVEIGEGFRSAALSGSEVHDAIGVSEADGRRWITRATNRAGGLEGGVTNGQPIIVRAAMKPIPTMTRPLPSVDISTLQAAQAHVERSDITAVPAARVVGEAMVAYVVAAAYLEKFGGDYLEDVKAAVAMYERRLAEQGLWRRL
ncbi:MAG: chorismate synthase [Thermoleophilia bacterium]|nr:chorismate synthase [Thermoleophilia bacterium]